MRIGSASAADSNVLLMRAIAMTAVTFMFVKSVWLEGQDKSVKREQTRTRRETYVERWKVVRTSSRRIE